MSKTNELNVSIIRAYDFAFAKWANAEPNTPEATQWREQLRLLDNVIRLSSGLVIEND